MVSNERGLFNKPKRAYRIIGSGSTKQELSISTFSNNLYEVI